MPVQFGQQAQAILLDCMVEYNASLLPPLTTQCFSFDHLFEVTVTIANLFLNLFHNLPFLVTIFTFAITLSDGAVEGRFLTTGIAAIFLLNTIMPSSKSVRL